MLNIDLRKAFDSVLNPALMLKLIELGVGGNFCRVLKYVYINIELRAKTDKILSVRRIFLYYWSVPGSQSKPQPI